MLSVFGPQRSSIGSPTKRPKKANESLTPEEEELVFAQFENLYNSLPRRAAAYVTEHIFGGGANGIAYVETSRHSLASDGRTTVFFSGELTSNGTDLEDAAYVLQEYTDWKDAGLFSQADVAEDSDRLGSLQGPFALVLYDRDLGRIVAARDVLGEEPLFWGTNMLGDGLLFSSDRSLIEKECADADFFPAGTLFVSAPGETTGTISNIRTRAAAAPSEPSESMSLPQSGSCSNLAAAGGTLTKTASQSHIAAK
jgi:hypothetical protein